MKTIKSLLLIAVMLVSTIMSAQIFESEPNDDFQNANNFPINTILKGNLSATDANDYYKVKLSSPVAGALALKLKANSVGENGGKIGYRLFSKEKWKLDEKIISFESNPTEEVKDSVVYWQFRDAEFYIQIFCPDNSNVSSKSYELLYEEMPDNEPNNTISQSIVLKKDSVVTGYLGYTENGQSTPDFSDFYKVELSNVNILNVTVDFIKHTPMSNYFGTSGIRIWSKKGEKIDEKYKDTSGDLFSTHHANFEFIKALVDTCYIEVCNVDTNRPNVYMYSYKMSFTNSPTPVTADIEPNDKMSEAIPLAMGETASGLVGFLMQTQGEYKLDTCDYYKFVLPRNGGILKLKYQTIKKHDEHGGTVDIRILTPDGNEIEKYSIDNGPYERYNFIKTDSIITKRSVFDTCYVEVKRANYGDKFRYGYTLKYDFLPSDPEPNNTIESAVPIESGDIINGLAGATQHTHGAGYVDAEDYFRIILPEKGKNQFLKVSIKARKRDSQFFGGTIVCRLWSKDKFTMLQRNYHDYIYNDYYEDKILYNFNNLDTCYLNIMSNVSLDYEFQYEIVSSPRAEFDYTQVSNTVTILNSAPDLPSIWNFGDGSAPVNTKFPVHTYSKHGEYIITRTVNIDGKQISIQAKEPVIISGVESVKPEFNDEPLGVGGDVTITIFGGGLTDGLNYSLTEFGSHENSADNPLDIPDIHAKSVKKIKDGVYEAVFDLSLINMPLEFFNICEKTKYKYCLLKISKNEKEVFKGNRYGNGSFKLSATIYPRVSSTIESTHNFQLRTGFTWPYRLALHNNGNIDALGVNAFLAVPEDIEITLQRPDFKHVIDSTKTFDFYCKTFNKSYSISNKDIIEVMDSLQYDYLTLDTLKGEPYKGGKIYKIFIPRIASNSTLRIPFRVKGISTQDISQSILISFTEGMNTLNANHLSNVSWAKERLKRYTSSALGALDSLTLFAPTDTITWYKTFRTRDDIIEQVLADELNKKGYNLDNYNKEYYDDGQLNKQIAQIILGLRAVANDYSIPQHPEGIIDMSERSYPNVKNQVRAKTISASPKAYFRLFVSKVKKAKKWSDRNGLSKAVTDGYNNYYHPGKTYGKAFNSTYKAAVTTDVSDGAQVMSSALDMGAKITPIAGGALAPLIAPIFTAGKLTLDAGVHMFGSYNKQLDEVMNSNDHRAIVSTGGARDPNEITGPLGHLAERYIHSSQTMNYLIRFENKAEASLPAQMVNITDTLDVNKYDLNSFELSSISLGDSIFQLPQGRKSYYFTYDMRPAHNWLVGISAKLDTITGIVHWQMVTLDPVKKDLIDDPIAGFLPPNKTAPEGEGSVAYTVKLKKDLPNRTTVTNRAKIVFDYNEPILTNVWTNTIDILKPASSGMRANQLTDSTFSVSWNSSDTESGVKFHRLYVSVNGNEFFPLGAYFGNSTTLYGQTDNVYSFYVETVDSVGNTETKQPVAETTIKLIKTGTTSVFSTKDLLSIFPNPATDYFILKDLEQESTITVYDVSGKKVIEKAIAPHEKISVSGWSKGVYFVKANGKTGKLIVN